MAFAFAVIPATALAASAQASGAIADALSNAEPDDATWILPAKTYAGNRCTALTQNDKTGVGDLRQAWRIIIADDGQQEAAPSIWNSRAQRPMAPVSLIKV